MTKAHWRILTIYRISGLSRVHFAKRWKLVWTRKVGVEWTLRLDPYWKSQLVAYKVNMEWKSELSPVNKRPFSRSWVRISHGLNKLVTNLIDKELTANDDEKETSDTKTEVFAFASRTKAKAKPTRPTSTCSCTRTVHMLVKENGLILSQELNSISLTQWQKRLNTLLRHGELLREEDGAIEFWRLKRWSSELNLSTINVGLMMYGRARWQEVEATRKYFNTVLTR